MWIDDLVAEGTDAEVGALGNVKDILVAWFDYFSTVGGPEAAKDAEKRRFSAAVWANNEKMHSRVDTEGQRFKKDVTCW